MQFHVLIEQDENGIYCASVPALPGCVSDGRTEAEARVNIRESMSLWLEGKDDLAIEALSPEQKEHLVLLSPEYIIAEAA